MFKISRYYENIKNNKNLKNNKKMAAPQNVNQHLSLYRHVRDIASGAYGKVTEVEVTKDFSNGKYKFMKGMRLDMKIDTTGYLGSISEIDILNRVNHPNIVEVYDTFNKYTNGNCESIILVIPLASYSLQSFIIKKHKSEESRKTLTDTVTLDLMHQLLCGLFYLHSNHIIHDDIKPDNVLVYEDDNNNNCLNVKITDFGLAATLVDPNGIKKLSQSLWWRPPEILRIDDGKSNKHSYESDVWAMGVVFLELITSENLHDVAGSTMKDLSIEDQLRAVWGFAKTDHWKKWDRFTGALSNAPDLISRMLDQDPNTRITSQEALRHPIFASYSCERQKVEKIPWDIGMIPASDVKYRNEILLYMKEIREWDWNVLFLGIDIADRYFIVMKGRGMELSNPQPLDILRVIDASLTLSQELAYILDNPLPGRTKYGYITDREEDNMTCDILEKLNWKLYRPTLYSENPDIDPEELFDCYLETTEPTLECVEAI